MSFHKILILTDSKKAFLQRSNHSSKQNPDAEKYETKTYRKRIIHGISERILSQSGHDFAKFRSIRELAPDDDQI